MTDPGYQIHQALLSDDEVQAVCDALTRAPRSRAGARHLMSEPAVAALAADSRLVGLASATLGALATPYRATLFDKAEGANWLVTWHQDTALPLQSRADVPGWGPWSTKQGIVYAHAPAAALEHLVALRVHLDDSTVENGPLRVIPGSHAQGVLTDAELDRVTGSRGAVACVAQRGGVLAMRPLLVHASSKAVGTKRRRVLHIEYTDRLAFGPGLSLHVA